MKVIQQALCNVQLGFHLSRGWRLIVVESNPCEVAKKTNTEAKALNRSVILNTRKKTFNLHSNAFRCSRDSFQTEG